MRQKEETNINKDCKGCQYKETEKCPCGKCDRFCSNGQYLPCPYDNCWECGEW